MINKIEDAGLRDDSIIDYDDVSSLSLKQLDNMLSHLVKKIEDGGIENVE